MRVWLQETAAVPHIRDLLGREGRGKGRVVLVPAARTGAKCGDRPARRLSTSRRDWRKPLKMCPASSGWKRFRDAGLACPVVLPGRRT